MALIPWQDHLDNNIVDHNGLDIQFKKTKVQIISAWSVTASAKIVVPCSVNINIDWNVDVTAKLIKYVSTTIGIVWSINPQSQLAVSLWDSIIIRYIGSRNVE